MVVLKDLVTVTGLRFVNVDVERRRRRDVVLSIREELVEMDGFQGRVRWGLYGTLLLHHGIHRVSAR